MRLRRQAVHRHARGQHHQRTAQTAGRNQQGRGHRAHAQSQTVERQDRGQAAFKKAAHKTHGHDQGVGAQRVPHAAQAHAGLVRIGGRGQARDGGADDQTHHQRTEHPPQVLRPLGPDPSEQGRPDHKSGADHGLKQAHHAPAVFGWGEFGHHRFGQDPAQARGRPRDEFQREPQRQRVGEQKARGGDDGHQARKPQRGASAQALRDGRYKGRDRKNTDPTAGGEQPGERGGHAVALELQQQIGQQHEVAHELEKRGAEHRPQTQAVQGWVGLAWGVCAWRHGEAECRRCTNRAAAVEFLYPRSVAAHPRPPVGEGREARTIIATTLIH